MFSYSHPGLRRPVVWWLVGVGVAFGCDVALEDVFLPLAENHWGATSSITAAIALLHQWCGAAAPVCGVGLIGLFPCIANIALHGQILIAIAVGLRWARLLGNQAIITFLPQLLFANDTPTDGEFRGRNAMSRPVGWVS